MAEGGTPLGELQRGWQRFWGLSWWWKGPIIGFVAFVVVGIVVSVAGGGDNDGSDSQVADTTPTPAEVTPSGSDSSSTESQGPYSILEIAEVAGNEDQVTISGRTDLPDGATISVTFDVWGRSPDDLYIGVDGGVTVSEGAFTITLSVPQRDEFIGGPYEVSLLFTPRGQSDQVIRLVGADGKNLTGDLVAESIIGFNTLRLAARFDDLEFFVEVPSYSFQQPSEFPQGSAERVVAEYVLAWKNQDWSRMAELAQKTWLNDEPDPAGVLEAWYDFKILLGFGVMGVGAVSDVTSDVTFVVQYEAFTNQIETKQITARVIKETAAFTPSEEGDWGVNPISALAEEDVD